MSAPDATAQVVQMLLLWLLLPVWLLAGFGDWLCHRVQRIERSTGLRESLLHLAMLAEIGIGFAAALVLQVNAAVLLLIAACCLAHEVTTWLDLRYAASVRRIPVVEQWVHSLQLVLPWTGLISLMVIHRDQALAIVGLGDALPDWRWRWKDPPLPASHVMLAFAAGALLVVLPFVEEWWRCLKARQAERS
ncbi:MAG: diguanylate cyclase [Rhizobacter sp.]